MKKNTIEFRKPPSDLVREVFKDVDMDYVKCVEFGSVAFNIEEIVDCDGREYVQVVRCRDCRHSRKEGTLCMFFASWEPIAGGDEYAEIPADVEPDGFCAWGSRRES